MTFQLVRHIVGLICIVYAGTAIYAVTRASEPISINWVLTVAGLIVGGAAISVLPELLSWCIGRSLGLLAATRKQPGVPVADQNLEDALTDAMKVLIPVPDAKPIDSPSIFDTRPVPTIPADEEPAMTDKSTPEDRKRHNILRTTELLVELMALAGNDKDIVDKIMALNDALFRKNSETVGGAL